jgi:hypothetical protein
MTGRRNSPAWPNALGYNASINQTIMAGLIGMGTAQKENNEVRNEGPVLAHQGYVEGLDGDVAADGTRRDTDVSLGQEWARR